MDRTAEYREIVKRVVSEYAAFKPSFGDIEVELLLDEAHDHYELSQSGWVGDDRIEGRVIHVDIRGGKVWIQHDGTEDGIANDLVAAGIPKEHIVLAWQPPYARKLTEFAVA